MGTLRVATASVRGGATRVSGSSAELTSSGAHISGTQGAAGDTRAADSYDAAISQVAQTLAGLGVATDGLGHRLGLAASCYEAADHLGR